MHQGRPEKANPITVREMLEAKGKEWDLELMTGERGLDRRITTFELNRPGLAMAGYYDVFSVERVQMIGLTETSYLKSLSPDERRMRLRRMLEFAIPCVIVTRSMEVAPELVELMGEAGVPLLRTSHVTSPFQAELGVFLERRLAPRWAISGVMIEAFGIGVLIQGKSGVGKSECALELIQRGHLLVADDVVIVRRVSRGRLVASPSPNLGYHMEIRGIGIIDAETLFGVRAVREESEVALVAELEKWDSSKEYERLGLVERTKTLFGCQVAQVILPIEPGRNIAQVVEVAALTQRLKAQGINTAEKFNERIMRLIEQKRKD